MNSIVLIIPVFVPILSGILIFILPRRLGGWKETLTLLGMGVVLVSAILLMRHTGEALHWGLNCPSLEINFNFSAPESARTTLLIATSLQTLLALPLLFLFPKKSRPNEYLFFFLYGSGIVNGIILSHKYVEMVLFGELLFVTIYGVVVLMGLLSSYSTRSVSNPGAVTHDGWSNSRIFILSRLEIIRVLRAFARLVFVSVDRGIDAIYERLLARDFGVLIQWLRKAHNGLYPNYLSWAVGGFILLICFLVFETP